MLHSMPIGPLRWGRWQFMTSWLIELLVGPSVSMNLWISNRTAQFLDLSGFDFMSSQERKYLIISSTSSSESFSPRLVITWRSCTNKLDHSSSLRRWDASNANFETWASLTLNSGCLECYNRHNNQHSNHPNFWMNTQGTKIRPCRNLAE